MKFDLFSLMQKRDESWSAREVFEDVADQVRLAEEIGFETAWFAEHHFSNYSLCPSPLMAMAYFAGRTTRIRLGSAVVVLPLYEPMRLAQEIGMVDVLSGGRLVLGIGSGYQAFEFERFRTPLDAETIDRTLEALDVIEAALTQDEFSFEGRYHHYPSTRIAIKPERKGLPEIWIAGMQPKLLARMAARGYTPMLTPGWKPTAELAPVRERLDGLYRDEGHDPAAQSMGLMRFVHVTTSRAEAAEAAERARYSSRVSLAFRLGYARMQGIYVDDQAAEGEPPLEQMIENYIIGDAQHCIEKILEDHAVLGHSHVLCNLQLGGVPRERVLHTLEALGGEIIPAVEKALAAPGRPRLRDSARAGRK